ncbi:MAG: hypothetical protein OSA81_01130 [Longimicrobiales bacterium]|nr:hypothetical protein [Longimicrobiales bacterium]
MCPHVRGVPLACLALLAMAPLAFAQEAAVPIELFAGDSVRINREMVGRILRIDGPNMVVVSRGIPKCRAGQMHGDAPICDPAPLIRDEMLLNEVTVEKRTQKSHINMRTVLGGVVGVVAFGAAGYYIGPAFGFGKVEGCVLNDASSLVQCSLEDTVPADEYRARQLKADQRRGVLFFGAIGGSAVAILARKLSVGWVEVVPQIPVSSMDPWGVSITIPGVH